MSQHDFDLLTLLNAVVLNDQGPSGLRGQVAIGVRGADGEQWWTAFLHPQARCEFIDARPEGAESALLLGVAEADSILKTGAPPENPELLVLYGDRDLLMKFLARYQPQGGMLSLRVGKATNRA